MIGNQPRARRTPPQDARSAARQGEEARTPEPADELLLAAYALGDPSAASLFVRRFQRIVYGVALAIVGPSTAEDIAQEAFERAWRHAASYDPRRGSVRAWLVRIVHNLAVDALRAQRTTPVAPENVAHLVDLLTPSPENAPPAGETPDRLRIALAAIPPEQSRAVVMAAVHGLTAREIAAIEDVPLGTAKARIRVALHKLHTALSTHEGQP